MENEILAENAVEEAVDATETEDGAAAVEEAEETTGAEAPNPVQETPAPPDPEEERRQARERTRAFSERLNAMSAKRLDDFVARMGWVNEYTGQPVKTAAEYDQYQAMRQAAKRGSDPVLAARLTEMETRIARYQDREQDEQMQSDPQYGEVYKELRDETMQLLDYCRRSGRGDVDLQSAFGVVLKNNMGRLFEKARGSAQSRAVRQIAAAAKATPGSLSAGTAPAVQDFATMSDDDFDKQIERALRGELTRK